MNNPERKNPLKIGITAGDPAGIGPEVSLKAINELSGLDYIPVLIARAGILEKYYPGLTAGFNIITHEESLINLSSNNKYLLNIPSNNPAPEPGKGSISTGMESRIYIDTAVGLWKRGLVDAIVTGPVNKSLIEKSGCRFTGHTEYIASLINEKNPYMLMYSGKYRVLLVTTHIPVADIPGAIDPEKIYCTIMAGYKAISSIDKGEIKMAIAGLDPHCGDDGAIGSFDREVTAGAVKKAVKNGINIEGPFAADTLFMPQKWERYNLVIAHYHDQGLIPFKALSFESGVNITLGLSVIRTSPDHGTAFDIAGKDMADHRSMAEAIKLAIKLSGMRGNPQGPGLPAPAIIQSG